MKVALCGATGRAGSRILNELLSRGHNVFAIVRQVGSLEPREGVSVAVDDLTDADRTAETIQGADALISAYAPPADDVEELVRVTKRLAEATARSGVGRFLMVGGAGSLEVAHGLTLLDSGKLPPEWLPIAAVHAGALEVLRYSPIDWTSLCPAAYFDPGERTGHESKCSTSFARFHALLSSMYGKMNSAALPSPRPSASAKRVASGSSPFSDWHSPAITSKLKIE